MFKKSGRKHSASFLAAVTGLLLVAGLLIGGLLKGNIPASEASDVLTGGTCADYLKAHPSINSAVCSAILAQEKNYLRGEFSTEGHVILGIKENSDSLTVYTMSSFGAFGFENGIFAKISGSGAIPTLMVFRLGGTSGYTLESYKEPLDGSGYVESIKKMFPGEFWNRVLKDNPENSELYGQQKSQAEAYLRDIGRDAKVADGNVEKQLPTISTAASNKIFSEFMKFDAELNKFPYWIGTREELVSGARFIYRTAQSKADDGCDLITFTKTMADGTVISEKKYKIKGDVPELLP